MVPRPGRRARSLGGRREAGVCWVRFRRDGYVRRLWLAREALREVVRTE